MSQSATPATQNDMTTCLETFEKERSCSFPHRHGDATGKPATRDKTRGCAEKRAFRARLPSILTFSTRYQTGWNVTKCHACHAKWHGNLRKERFCSFPHRHGEATGKPETRDETRGAPKRAFRARLPSIFTLCSFKIDVVLRVFLRTGKFATSKSMFRARLPSIFSTSHKMLRLPRNLHLVAIWRSQCDSQKTHNTTRLKCCACHAKWRWTRPKCCACHENCNASSENVAKVLRLPHKTTFDTLQNTSECHEVPRLPRETKQRNLGNIQKWPLLQNLP